MIFGRKKQAEPEPDEQPDVDFVSFQGPFNGVQPNLGANARLVQAALVPAKELLTDAILRRAEQIRLDPKGAYGVVRLFVDGVPYPAAKMPRQQAMAVTQMVKLLAGLDVKERERPQSGGMKAEQDGTPYEIRVQSAPAEGAERLTVRIENVKTRPERPDELGLNNQVRDTIRERTLDKGALFCCGAPGSGVTTTTFGLLKSLDPYTRSILTLGDTEGRKLVAINPFEWQKADGIEIAAQRAIRTEADVLYLDPIRDAATAKAALGLSELITFVAEFTAKDVVSGVGQLLQWTGDGALVADNVRVIVSPKLIRKLCTKCKQIFKPNPKVLLKLGLPPEVSVLYRPPRPPQAGTPEADTYSPCNQCGGLGYLGRIGIFEILEMTEGMKNVLKSGPTPSAIRQQMKADDMATFQKESLRLVGEGVTSLEEVQRVFQQPAG